MPTNIDPRSRSPTTGLDPSLPSTTPNVPKVGKIGSGQFEQPPKKFADYFYNKETNEYCGRTCSSWIKIITYGIFYLMFLCTYTLIVLYITLLFIIRNAEFKPLKPSSLIYPASGIGITAIPTSESNVPLIWYRKGEKRDYAKYVQAIDRFLLSNRKKEELDNLGPCGRLPYGYGEKPCVIIKINKYFHWLGKPLHMNSSVIGSVPPDVIKWIMTKKNKYWLECSGYHPYDREHIGSIKYYPDPPGFDPEVFPLTKETNSPLVAIQISDYTLGVSLAIECKLWYQSGPSIVDFVLYVAPNDSIAFPGQTYD